MTELLGIGLQLTVFGMGLVFLLLALLWGLMTMLLRLDQAPAPAEAEQVPPTAGEAIAQLEYKSDPDKLAAITIAVLTHRMVRRKQAAPAMRSHQPGTLPSRWVGAGRTRQNQSWHPQRRE
jgi:sodium pump decarboxylase gamma subunit